MSRFRAVNLLIAAGLVALLLWKVNLGEVGDSLREVNAGLLVAVLALNIPVLLLFAARSDLLLRRLGHRVDPRLLLPAMVLGNVAGSLTPAASGELLRTAMLRSHADIRTEDGLALVLYERGVSVYMLALGAGLAAALVELPPAAGGPLAAAGLLLLAVPPLAIRLLPLLPAVPAGRQGIAWRAFRALLQVASQVRRLLDDLRLFVAWSALTAAILGIAVVQLWLLARSLAPGVNPAEAWLGFGASQLAAIASLLPLGIGAADSSLAALMRRFGMTLEQGTVVAILVRATITLPLGLAAVGCYLYLLRRAPAAGGRSPVLERERPGESG